MTKINYSTKDRYRNFLHYRKSILEAPVSEESLILYKKNVKAKPNTIEID